MKLNQIGPNEVEIEFNNGVIVLFSYTGAVAAYKPGLGAVKTDQFFSKTTNRHVAHWMMIRGFSDCTEVHQAAIDNIVGA